MCAVVIQGPLMSIINIQNSSICPVDRVEVPDLTNDSSHITDQEELSILSLARLEDKQNLLELTIHLCNTQEILEQEWFRGKHILKSNKALDYDSIRAKMKFNISKSYNLLGKAIDSMNKNFWTWSCQESRCQHLPLMPPNGPLHHIEDATLAFSSLLGGC